MSSLAFPDDLKGTAYDTADPDWQARMLGLAVNGYGAQGSFHLKTIQGLADAVRIFASCRFQGICEHQNGGMS